MKIIDFSSFEAQFGAQIGFEEALKLRKKELEGAESKLRERKEGKRAARSPQRGPKARSIGPADRL